LLVTTPQETGEQPRLDHQLCAIQFQETRPQQFELRRVGFGKADAHHGSGAVRDLGADEFEGERRQPLLAAQRVERTRQVRCGI